MKFQVGKFEVPTKATKHPDARWRDENPCAQRGLLGSNAGRSFADSNGNGSRTIRAAVYIGGGIYSHDLGIIGQATNHEDAIRRFGDITWTDTELRIGGTDGVQATLDRALLEQHR